MALKYEDLTEYEKEFKMIPVYEEIMSDCITPINLLRKIANKYKDFYLLESVEQGGRWGRYSFLGYKAKMDIVCKNGKVVISEKDNKKEVIKDPVELIRTLLNEYKAPRIKDLPSFTGGLVGYFSYNMVAYEYSDLYLQESDFNDYDLMLFDKVVAFDHLKQKIIVIVNYESRLGEAGYKEAVEDINKIIEFIRSKEELFEEYIDEVPDFKANINKEDFCKKVNKAKSYIEEKRISQVVLSRRYEADYKHSLLNTYRVLRTTNPSPYMYYIKTKDVEIAGASPETLVKLDGKNISTFPIAGTRRRGLSESEDLELEQELLNDKKELLEHNMLVDLAQKDLSKVALKDSIKIKEFQKIHRFSKVMHIVSQVDGRIRKDKDGLNTISALLPAGTLSGSPKKIACEIIEELEPDSRGIYGGAIGYINFSGDLDVCITIRTAIKKDNKVYIQAGCGVVKDSVDINEYIETKNKAAAIIEAVKRAGEVK